MGETLPLFEGIEPAPSGPKKPSTRALKRRLVKAVLAWYRGEGTPRDVWILAKELNEHS